MKPVRGINNSKAILKKSILGKPLISKNQNVTYDGRKNTKYSIVMSATPNGGSNEKPVVDNIQQRNVSAGQSGNKYENVGS